MVTPDDRVRGRLRAEIAVSDSLLPELFFSRAVAAGGLYSRRRADVQQSYSVFERSG
jgi:hypothetical protein